MGLLSLSLALSPGVFFLGGGSTSGGKSGINRHGYTPCKKRGCGQLLLACCLATHTHTHTHTHTEDEEDRREANIQGLSVLRHTYVYYLRRQHPSVIVSTRLKICWKIGSSTSKRFLRNGGSGRRWNDLKSCRRKIFLGVRERPFRFS